MKLLNSILLILTITLFSACKSAYYNTVNDMKMISGTVYTNDGKEITGPLTINLENYRPSKLYLKVNDQEVNLTDIKGVNVRNDYYEPKLIDLGNNQFRFLKRLTKDSSRIHLYEYNDLVTRQRSNRFGSTGQTFTQPEYSYYIVTPQHTRQMPAWNLEGRRLTPDFENKMSDIVKDCPTLAEKIRKKEKGYFYAQISLIDVKKIETMMTIIDEYNRCNAK